MSCQARRRAAKAGLHNCIDGCQQHAGDINNQVSPRRWRCVATFGPTVRRRMGPAGVLGQHLVTELGEISANVLMTLPSRVQYSAAILRNDLYKHMRITTREET